MSGPENPPAFPGAGPRIGEDGYGQPVFAGPTGGMTLRDWFAGQVLAAFASNVVGELLELTDWSIEATDAYAAADAMLAIRVKSGTPD